MKLINNTDGKVDIVAVQGKTWTIYFKLKDENGNVIDITNATIRGQIRKSWDSTDVVASWQITKTNSAQGEFKAIINPSVTATISCGNTIKDTRSQYVYDFEIEFEDGTVMEIIKGKLFVEWEVTK